MNEHENNRLNKVLECEGCDDYMIIDRLLGVAGLGAGDGVSGVGLSLPCHAELEVDHLLALQTRETTLLYHSSTRRQDWCV